MDIVWNEPGAFVLALFLITVAGALLPVRIVGREDHFILIIMSGILTAIFGAPGLVLVWFAIATAMPLLVLSYVSPTRRAMGVAGIFRSIAWVVVSAVCASVGFFFANLVYTGGFHRSFPITLNSTPEVLIGALTGFVAWSGAMSVRLLSQQAISESFLAGATDPLESAFFPYLLPAIAGMPLITAAVALYRPNDPWSVLLVLAWLAPIYLAATLELRRRRTAKELRREMLARQRLAAIGEVSARIVHQSRHQVGLMGWSIHRLRQQLAELASTDPALDSSRDARASAARQELDALASAKDRLSEMLASELLFETGDDATPDDQVADGVAPEPIDESVATLIAEVTRQLQAEADREGVSLRVDLASSNGRRVARKPMHDAAFNLIDNAIDAAEHEVVVRVFERDDGGLEICVTDDGPGLPTGDEERLFEPFFTTKSDGTGMGLAIADALIGDLGGELSYGRDDGRTSFTIALPAATPAPS